MELKVFIEYKMIAEKRASFLAIVPELRKHADEHNLRQYSIYEGTDQPNLIVEEFLVDGMESYRKIKAQRLDEHSPFWAKVHEHIAGGAGKFHIWAFQSLE